MTDEASTTSEGASANGSIVEHKRVRQRHGRGRARIALNITPMIDVVFLLLIYFMAATNFKLGEEIFRMDLPERGRAQDVDPFRLDEQPLRILVISTGPGAAEYGLQVTGALAHRPKNLDELYRFLQERRIGRAQGLFASDHPIIIEPAQEAHWEHAIGAFNAAVRAEYTNVSFRSAQ